MQQTPPVEAHATAQKPMFELFVGPSMESITTSMTGLALSERTFVKPVVTKPTVVEWICYFCSCEPPSRETPVYGEATSSGTLASEIGSSGENSDEEHTNCATSFKKINDTISEKNRVVDQDGNIYFGDIKNGLRHGKGHIFYVKTDDRYIGQWKDDVPHGEGIFRKGDRTDDFEGLWQHGDLVSIKSGTAYVADIKGNQYYGAFKDWKKHGQGTFTKPNGEMYIGHWERGLRHGFGTLLLADGSRSEGIFRNGKEQ